jgi:hypothetical protein
MRLGLVIRIRIHMRCLLALPADQIKMMITYCVPDQARRLRESCRLKKDLVTFKVVAAQSPTLASFETQPGPTMIMGSCGLCQEPINGCENWPFSQRGICEDPREVL